jgi:penicillin-binding protein 1A
MNDVGWLSADQYKKALAEPLRLNMNQRDTFAFRADYIAEMARAAVFEQYGDSSYVSGIRVHTSISRAHQEAANNGLRLGVLEYDRRHGYRGPEGYASLPADGPELEEAIEEALQERDVIGDLVPAVVLDASAREVTAIVRKGDAVKISGDGLKFAARALTERNPDRAIRRGAIIRLQAGDKGAWSIAQLPRVESALAAVDPRNGAILALAGGFDFNANKFNHATQAWRQPGSSFKPFIYSAALEKGFTPATILNDAPFVIEAAKTGGQLWEPKNYDGKYEGPMRLRTALAKSKNMVSIRLLQAIGTHYAQDYVQRFGFDPKMHPAYLTMALGAGATTPLQMAGAYSVFANGGYRVKPWFISRIEDNRGQVLYASKPEVAGEDAERVLDGRNAFIMTSLMRDVVRYGTAARAMSLGRQDLAGKTGTTNDHVDAWFAGFQGQLVAVAWIGYDTPANLGANETGGQAALPIWMGYASKVLKGVPETELKPPPGVVAVSINPMTGLREPSGASKTAEFFYQESQPPVEESAVARDGTRPDRRSPQPDLLTMTKARSRRGANLRRQIAYIAARLMAEDGVPDYATAKLKAARQAGLGDSHLLPDNAEVEAALREYQGLYQKEEQPAHLRHLREIAVKVMRDFDAFRPALVGSVLTGTAGQFSDVNLQLFIDDPKVLTMFLLNRRYRFEEGSRRMRLGDAFTEVPQVHLNVEDVPVTLTILDRDDERHSPRPRSEGDPPQRARLAEVEALLGAPPPSSA